MTGVTKWLLAAVCGVLGALPASARVVPAIKLESSSYPITAISADVAVSDELLKTADASYAYFLKRLKTDSLGGVHFVVYSLPWEEGTVAASVSLEFPRKLQIFNRKPRFVVETHGSPARIRESLVRTLMTVYLQALAWKDVDFPREGKLVSPPYWLVEGLTQGFLVEQEDLEGLTTRHDNWARVMWRLNLADRIPSLDEIQGWEDLGGELPEKFQHKAVTYWLVRSALDNSAEAGTLALWLGEHRTDEGARYWGDNPAVDGWWKETASLPEKPSLPLYNWDQTAVRLGELLDFSSITKGGERHLLNVGRLPESREDFTNIKDLMEVENGLIRLQMQGHWFFNGVIAAYRQAIGEWSRGDYTAYRASIRRAEELQQRAYYMIGSSGDLLDWVTANFPVELESGDVFPDDGAGSSYVRLIDRLEEERYHLRREETEAGEAGP